MPELPGYTYSQQLGLEFVKSDTNALLEKLSPLQWLLIIINPASASLYLGKEAGEEVATKVIELNLIDRLLALWKPTYGPFP